MPPFPAPGLERNLDQEDWDEWIASLTLEQHRAKLNALDALFSKLPADGGSPPPASPKPKRSR